MDWQWDVRRVWSWGHKEWIRFATNLSEACEHTRRYNILLTPTVHSIHSAGMSFTSLDRRQPAKRREMPVPSSEGEGGGGPDFEEGAVINNAHGATSRGAARCAKNSPPWLNSLAMLYIYRPAYPRSSILLCASLKTPPTSGCGMRK